MLDSEHDVNKTGDRDCLLSLVFWAEGNVVSQFRNV